MADLYHLLDELQEREEEEQRTSSRGRNQDDDDESDDDEHDPAADNVRGMTNTRKTTNDDNRRLTVETAATADMSYDDDDDGDYDDEDDGDVEIYQESEGLRRRHRPVVVPEALRRHDITEEAEGDDSTPARGGIEDFLEEEEFDKADTYAEDDHEDGLNKKKRGTTRSTAQRAFLDEQDRDVENMITDEMYGTLHRRWLEEQHSPELLPFDEELVQDLKLKLEKKQDELDEKTSEIPDYSTTANRGAGADSHAVHLLMTDIEQQDLDRVKFVLADWLNVRIQKIEAFALYYYNKNKNQQDGTTPASQQTDRMSQTERDYLEQYWALERRVFEVTVTDHMPSGVDRWNKLDSRNMIDEPDTTGYNFWVVQNEQLELGDEVHDAHSCLIAKYSKMRQHMEDGKVRLLM